MSKRLLVIDGDDQGHFFLVVDGGTLTIGGQAADMVLRGLRVSRIRCEVEVDQEVVAVGEGDAATIAAPGASQAWRQLRPGEAVHIGVCRLRLEAAEAAGAVLGDDEPRLAADTPAQAVSPTAAQTSLPAHGPTPKKLLVIDGGDKGRFFPLPETGAIAIGKSSKHAQIALHDLYVARIHCEVENKDDRVFITHVEGKNGTLISGKRINEKQELHLGEVLRVGNSHLRLEILAPGEREAAAKQDDAADMLTLDRAGDKAAAVEANGDSTVALGGETVCLPYAPVDQLLQLEDQVLGHYRIGALLGRGQCGLVFRAQDTKNDHVVALKVLSPDFPKSDAELQCFVRALKVVPQFHHPHLVTLHGAGRTGLYCWIAKEYIEGESLARLLQRLHAESKGIDWTHACRLASHLAGVLALCQKHGIVHGNITPRNILLEKGTRSTKLTDLMLRQALEGSQLAAAIHKRKLLAELPYLAPEQTEPKTAPDQRTDIYALGAVLYHLLTGQPPFSGANSAEVVTQIREGKLARPGTFQRGIYAPFETLVMRMMARKPEERFQSADELLQCLEPIANAVAM